MARRAQHRGEGPITSARDARGGEIILNTRRRQLVFMGGLIAFVVFALIAALLAPH
jgi:hypothetical protein